MRKDIRIAVRVTVKEKEKIQDKARKCGLSTTEYVKQRALGYEPKGIPPDALFVLLEKIGELEGKSSSDELNTEADPPGYAAAGCGRSAGPLRVLC